MRDLQVKPGDALIVVDVQRDFLPGGSLAVPRGDEVVSVLNEYLRCFVSQGLPVIATRDWHPADHCSFRERGGHWPPHCVAGTKGAAFPSELLLPPSVTLIDKANLSDQEAYSGFAGTDLARRLRQAGLTRLFIGGLATDYCVLNTVADALGEGFSVVLLVDAVRAVDVQPHDGERAVARMSALGAIVAGLGEVQP